MKKKIITVFTYLKQVFTEFSEDNILLVIKIKLLMIRSTDLLPYREL